MTPFWSEKETGSQSEASRAFGVHTSGLNDKVGRNAGNGFGLFRCEVFAVISVLFNAVNPLVAEGLVVQTFFEEDAADTGAKAASVPCLGWRWMVASSATLVRRASITMMLTPRC